MIIIRKFTPITIELESKEDVELFSDIIKHAQRYYMNRNNLFTGEERFKNDYMKKTSSILERLLHE